MRSIIQKLKVPSAIAAYVAVFAVSVFGFTLSTPLRAYAQNSDITVTIDSQGTTWTKKGDVIPIYYTFRNNTDQAIKITKYTSSLHLTSSSKDNCESGKFSIVGKTIGAATADNPNGALLGCTVHYTITAADVKAKVVKDTVTLGWSGGKASGSMSAPLTGVVLCDDGTPAGASGCTASQQDPSQHTGGLVTFCADGTKLTGTSDCSSHGGLIGSGPAPSALMSGDCTTGLSSCGLVQKYLNPFIKFLSAFVGLAVIISVIIGGIQYGSSAGDPQKAAAAISRIRNSVIALITYVFLLAMLNFLIPGGLK